jgi:hypothetical protein
VDVEKPSCNRNRIPDIGYLNSLWIGPIAFIGGAFDLQHERFEIEVLSPLLDARGEGTEQLRNPIAD